MRNIFSPETLFVIIFVLGFVAILWLIIRAIINLWSRHRKTERRTTPVVLEEQKHNIPTIWWWVIGFVFVLLGIFALAIYTLDYLCGSGGC